MPKENKKAYNKSVKQICRYFFNYEATVTGIMFFYIITYLQSVGGHGNYF